MIGFTVYVGPGSGVGGGLSRTGQDPVLIKHVKTKMETSLFFFFSIQRKHLERLCVFVYSGKSRPLDRTVHTAAEYIKYMKFCS